MRYHINIKYYILPQIQQCIKELGKICFPMAAIEF